MYCRRLSLIAGTPDGKYRYVMMYDDNKDAVLNIEQRRFSK